MTNQDQDARLSQLIEELGTVEPPAGLPREVMAKISLEARQPRARVIPFKSGSISMIRKAMWGLAAAAAIVLVVYSIKGFPPVGRGTEGTIGAAQKYQAQQIGSNDVKLGDAEVQSFLQSDVFDQLVKDPDARDLVSNTAVRKLLEDASLRNAIATDAGVRKVLTSDAVHRLYDDAETRAALESEFRADLAAAAKKAMADVRGQQARAAVANVLSDAQMRSVLANDNIRRALDNGELRQTMADLKMARALNSAAFMRAINHQAFARAYSSSAFAQALAPR